MGLGFPVTRLSLQCAPSLGGEGRRKAAQPNAARFSLASCALAWRVATIGQSSTQWKPRSRTQLLSGAELVASIPVETPLFRVSSYE